MSFKKILLGALVFVFCVGFSQNAQAYTFTSYLKIGSSGPEVIALQDFLISKGHLVWPAGADKGFFGAVTEAAVKKWQVAEKILDDGTIGEYSRSVLNGTASLLVDGPKVTIGLNGQKEYTITDDIKAVDLPTLTWSTINGSSFDFYQQVNDPKLCDGVKNSTDFKSLEKASGSYQLKTTAAKRIGCEVKIFLNVKSKDGKSVTDNVTIKYKKVESNLVNIAPEISYVEAKAANRNELYSNEKAVLYGKNLDKNTRVFLADNDGVENGNREFETANPQNGNITIATFNSNSIKDGDYYLYAKNGDKKSNTIKIAYKNSSTPTPPTGYTYCAKEGETCTFTGTKDVIYGANGKWSKVKVGRTTSFACNNDTFGDSNKRVVKACFIKNSPSIDVELNIQNANINTSQKILGVFWNIKNLFSNSDVVASLINNSNKETIATRSLNNGDMTGDIAGDFGFDVSNLNSGNYYVVICDVKNKICSSGENFKVTRDTSGVSLPVKVTFDSKVFDPKTQSLLLSGTATNIPTTGTQNFGLSISSKSGDKVWGSGILEVKNNKWSVNVSNANLVSGTYTVVAGLNNVEIQRTNVDIIMPVGPVGYTYCAAEGQTCTFTGTKDVKYGANEKWAAVKTNRTTSIACNNDTFGSDPIRYVKKACFIKDSVTTTATPPANTTIPPTNTTVPAVSGPQPDTTVPATNPVTQPAADYVFCSNEGQTCTFTGTKDVRYGANGRWATVKTNRTTSIACNNNTFGGDPYPFVKKACYIKDSVTASPTSLNRTLKVGDEGSDVAAVQEVLKKKGFFTEEITGFFGRVTAKAVSAFQQANALEAVGEVGPRTQGLLNSLLGN